MTDEVVQTNFGAVLQQRYQRNLKALQELMPALHRQFVSYQPHKGLEFFAAPTGEVNLRLTSGGGALYPGADPRGFCERQIEEILQQTRLVLPEVADNPDTLGQIHKRYVAEGIAYLSNFTQEPIFANKVDLIPNCLFFGMGLGYALEALYARVEVANLVLIEPDEDLFFVALHCVDLASLLYFLRDNHSLIKFIVGGSPDEICQNLLGAYEDGTGFMAPARCDIVHDSRAQMAGLKERIDRIYPLLFKGGFFDDYMFGLCHGIQAIENGRGFVRADFKLDAEFAKAPVFIVGNGPSLDHDLPFLRSHQDQAVIIACGSALDTLYHAGVSPDFYCCTERVPEIAQTLACIPDQDFVRQVILLASEVVHPDTAAHFAAATLFIKQGEVLDNLLCEVPLKRITHMNPLVGNLGAAAAVALGFKEMYLFGQDFGRRVGSEELHPQGGNLYKKGGVSIEGLSSYALGHVVPANFGGQCECGSYFETGLKVLEDLLAGCRDSVHCYNCSDGAAVAGATARHSAALSFETLPLLDKNRLKSQLCSQTIRWSDHDRFATALLRQDMFEAVVTRLLKLLESTPADRKGYLELMTQAVAVLGILEQNKLGHVSKLLRGSVEYFATQLLQALYLHSDPTEPLKVACRIKDNLCNFLRDAVRIYKLAPEYALGQHRTLLKGKVGFDHEHSKAPPLPPVRELVPKTYVDTQKTFIKRYA